MKQPSFLFFCLFQANPRNAEWPFCNPANCTIAENEPNNWTSTTEEECSGGANAARFDVFQAAAKTEDKKNFLKFRETVGKSMRMLTGWSRIK